jgi:hypothetical protein
MVWLKLTLNADGSFLLAIPVGRRPPKYWLRIASHAGWTVNMQTAGTSWQGQQPPAVPRPRRGPRHQQRNFGAELATNCIPRW